MKLWLIALFLSTAVAAQAMPAPIVGPVNPWPWASTIGGNLVTNGGFSTGGVCSLNGWATVVQPGNTVVSQNSVTDGSQCSAKFNTAGTGVGLNLLYQTITLPGSAWYKLQANVASTDNNLTLMTIQYANPPNTTAASAVVRQSFTTVTGVPQTTSLQTTVCTAGTCLADQCFNLNRLNSDKCTNATQYLTIQQLAAAINAIPHYTATIVAAPSTSTSTLNPVNVDILTSAGALPATNLASGGRCSVGGVNLNIGAAGVLGNSTGFKYTHNLLWHNITTEKVTIKCQTTGNVNGQQYFDSVNLQQLQAPPVDLVLRYPNDRFTEFSGQDIQVDYEKNQTSACSGVSGCTSNQCGIVLRNGSSILSTQCVTPTASWQTLTVPFASRPSGNSYNIQMTGSSYTPQINFRKTPSVPANWNYYLDPAGWFHYAGNITPRLSIGAFDTSQYSASQLYYQCWLNGVTGAPNPIISIAENGTTITVVTKNAHSLTIGQKFALAQFLTPLAQSFYENNWIVTSVIDSKTFTFTGPTNAPSVSNDGVVGGACTYSQQGAVGTIARLDSFQDYVNYYITNGNPAQTLIPLGQVLAADGIIQSQVINDQYTPFNALDPIINGHVCSADNTSTGCYCTNGGVIGNNATWSGNGSLNAAACTGKGVPQPCCTGLHTGTCMGLCGPGSAVGYVTTAMCSVYCPDDINDRYTTTNGQPSMGQLYEYDEPPEEYFLSVLNMQQYTRTYTADFALSGVLLGLGLPDVWRFIPFRDVDLPGIDNYALYANIPQGGPNPAFQPSLAPTGTLPANPGIQQSVQAEIIAENGNPYSNPITWGIRPVRATLQFFGYANGTRWPTRNQLRAEFWQAITAGAQQIDVWSLGLDGWYSLRSCPDFGSNTKACQSEFLNTLHQVMQEIRTNEQIITGIRVTAPAFPSGVTGFASTSSAGTWIVEENNNAASVKDNFGQTLGAVGSGTDLLIFQSITNNSLYSKYKAVPTIEYLGRDVWRAWLREFHIHTDNAS